MSIDVQVITVTDGFDVRIGHRHVAMFSDYAVALRCKDTLIAAIESAKEYGRVQAIRSCPRREACEA